MMNEFKALGTFNALLRLGFRPLRDRSFYWSRTAALQGADALARLKGQAVVATYCGWDGEGIVAVFATGTVQPRPAGLSTGKFSWPGFFTA